VVDQLAPNMALPGEARHPANRVFASLPENLLAWRTGLTILFAGSNESFEFEPDGSGAYWSQLRFSSNSKESGAIEIDEPPNSGGLDAVHTAWPRPIRPGIWAVRTLIDRGPMATALRVSLKRMPGRGWAATLEGLPESANLVAAQLRISKSYIPLSDARLGQLGRGKNSWTVMFEDDFIQASPAAVWDERSPEQQRWGGMAPIEAGERGQLPLGSALRLVGPIERTASIDTLVDTGRYALLQFQYTDMPLDIHVPIDGLSSERTTFYRIVIPIMPGELEASDD